MDTLWFNIGLVFLFLGTVSVNCKSVNEMQFQHMKKILDESELDNLRQRNEVSAVYYYKRGKYSQISMNYKYCDQVTQNLLTYIRDLRLL